MVCGLVDRVLVLRSKVEEFVSLVLNIVERRRVRLHCKNHYVLYGLGLGVQGTGPKITGQGV